MSLTIQQIVSDAKRLVERLREHDSAADTLIAQTQILNKKVDGMRQYQEDVTDLNEVARHRPRSTLVLGIQQENRHIRELQQENKELRLALEEHQSALELVMSKYREQILKLLVANKLDKTYVPVNNSPEVLTMTEKICEMAAIMQKAIHIDDKAAVDDRERFVQLLIENRGLREMLEISTTTKHRILPSICFTDKEVQTELNESS